MTNTNTTKTAAAIAFEYAQAADSFIDFDPARLVMRDEATFSRLARNAAYFLSAPVCDGTEYEDENEDEDTPEAFDPLGIEFFRNAENGEFIADVDLTVGGPSIWARYESRRGRLTLFAHWGSDELEFTSDDCPLIDWIKCAEDCAY